MVQVYTPASNSWVISTPLPDGLSLAALGVDSLGRLIVMGGVDTNGNDVSDVWRSQQFGVPDSAPVLAQFPSTSATYLAAYTSSINATLAAEDAHRQSAADLFARQRPRRDAG